jgi:toxin ParE1/3/4
MSVHRRRIVFSKRARKDFNDIRIYTQQQWGEDQRLAYEAKLDAAVERLRDFPHLGRAYAEIDAGVRIWRVERHVIYYRVSDDAITILRIVHERMDVSTILGE